MLRSVAFGSTCLIDRLRDPLTRSKLQARCYLLLILRQDLVACEIGSFDKIWIVKCLFDLRDGILDNPNRKNCLQGGIHSQQWFALLSWSSPRWFKIGRWMTIDRDFAIDFFNMVYCVDVTWKKAKRGKMGDHFSHQRSGHCIQTRHAAIALTVYSCCMLDLYTRSWQLMRKTISRFASFCFFSFNIHAIYPVKKIVRWIIQNECVINASMTHARLIIFNHELSSSESPRTGPTLLSIEEPWK